MENTRTSTVPLSEQSRYAWIVRDEFKDSFPDCDNRSFILTGAENDLDVVDKFVETLGNEVAQLDVAGDEQFCLQPAAYRRIGNTPEVIDGMRQGAGGNLVGGTRSEKVVGTGLCEDAGGDCLAIVTDSFDGLLNFLQ